MKSLSVSEEEDNYTKTLNDRQDDKLLRKQAEDEEN